MVRRVVVGLALAASLAGAVTALAADAKQAPGAQVVPGTWKDGALQIERTMGRGGKLTQTRSLEEGGRVLVVRTSLPSFGDMPARDLKRVYRKVGD